MTLPAGTIFRHPGATTVGPPLTPVDNPPAVVRDWNDVPAAADTSIIAQAAFAVSPERTIRPAFAQRCVFSMVVTRATSWPSPLSVRLANWKASAAPQISAPPPETTNAVPFAVEEPFTPGAPISWLDHPAGNEAALTRSIVAAASCGGAWPATARPAHAVPVMAMFS